MCVYDITIMNDQGPLWRLYGGLLDAITIFNDIVFLQGSRTEELSQRLCVY